ncbi:MAG TPA: hypothetical protein VGG29_19740 [Caulobacteraceae bacterium]
MATTTVSDYVIWAKHVHDDPELADRFRSLWSGQTIQLEVDGVRGIWRKMDDGADGRSTPGLKPVGAAQEVWRYLFKHRRGEVVTLKEIDEAGGMADGGSFAVRGALIFAPIGRTAEEREAALAALLDGGREGYSSEGRTMTRDEMHER